MFRKSRLLTVALLVVGATMMMIASAPAAEIGQMRQDVVPTAEPMPADDEVLLPINRDWFPADRYPDDQYDFMFVPEGDLPICQEVHPEWFDDDLENGIEPSPPPTDEQMDDEPTCAMASIRGRGEPGDGILTPPDSEDAAQSSALQSGSYRYLAHVSSCVSGADPCNTHYKGIDQAFVILSPYKPTVLSGSQTNFHFANRTHVGGLFNGNPITCPGGLVTRPNVATGLFWGGHPNFSHYGTGMAIFWERFDASSCVGYHTGVVIIDSYGPITFKFIATNIGAGSATWTMYGWLSGQWTQLGYTNISVARATIVDSGLEFWDSTQQFTQLRIPLNFVAKVNIRGTVVSNWTSIHDNVLPARWSGKTVGVYEGSWIPVNLSPNGDYTGVAGRAN